APRVRVGRPTGHICRKRRGVLLERRRLLRGRLPGRVRLARRVGPCGRRLQEQDGGHCDGRRQETRAETETLGGTQGAPVIGSARSRLRGTEGGIWRSLEAPAELPQNEEAAPRCAADTSFVRKVFAHLSNDMTPRCSIPSSSL